MSTPLDEIRRLRAELAEKDRQLAELRGLVAKHIEATSGDDQRALEVLQREKDAFDRGYQHGDETGWRRGVEHALMAVDEAHWKGQAHDHHGQMRELGLHDGPVPEPKSPDQVVALAERQARIMADWWWKEHERTHPQPQAEVREMRPKGRDAEREAV